MLRRATETTSFYQIPLGRAEFALTLVQARATELGQDEIARLAERAVDEVRRSMRIVLSFDAEHSTSLYPAKAKPMDAVVDRLVTAVQSYCDVQVRAYPGESRAEAAARISRTLFPNGAGAVTRLPFAEEHAQIKILLERAAADDLVDAIALLPELPALLGRLAERNREYGEVLRERSGAPTRDDVNKARAVCQERFAEVAALIIGLYALRAPDDIDGREHLLEPILEQNEAVRVARRRRQLPTDVDPETGEEVGASDPLPGDSADAGADADDDPAADDGASPESGESRA